MAASAWKKIFPDGRGLLDGNHLNRIFTAAAAIQGLVTGTLTATGAAAFTGGVTLGGVQVDQLTTVAAAGASLGTATAIPITANTVVVTVTASTEGVKLPVASTGRSITILANPTVGNKVYGAAAGQLIGANTTATT